MANEHSQGVARRKYNRPKIVQKKDKTAEIKNQLERNASSTALMLESPRLERHFNAAYQPRNYYPRVMLMATSVFILELLATVQSEVNLRSSPSLPFDIPPGGPKPGFKEKHKLWEISRSEAKARQATVNAVTARLFRHSSSPPAATISPARAHSPSSGRICVAALSTNHP